MTEGDPADRFWILIEGEPTDPDQEAERLDSRVCLAVSICHLPTRPSPFPAGEVVALYHYKEAERIEGPAVVGESVLLQVRVRAVAALPSTRGGGRERAAAGACRAEAGGGGCAFGDAVGCCVRSLCSATAPVCTAAPLAAIFTV